MLTGSALKRYWQFVKPENLELEQSLERLDLEQLRALDALGWYSFLHNQYFRWKYTARNRYATTTKALSKYIAEPGGLAELDRIRCRLSDLDPSDSQAGLSLACEIKGLGTAGASGLLALMYPAKFATVDQFVAKALLDVDELAEREDVDKMNPKSLTIHAGVVLIGIMRRKAAENNRLFGLSTWTPRKIDQILWTYGRPTAPKSPATRP
jgi:hypothetical protein